MSLKVRAFLCPQLHSEALCFCIHSGSLTLCFNLVFAQTFLSFFCHEKNKILYYLTPMFRQSRLLPIPHLFSEWSTCTLKALQNPTVCSFSSQIFNLWVFIATCRLKIWCSDKDNSPVVENFRFSRSLVSIYDRNRFFYVCVLCVCVFYIYNLFIFWAK